MAYNMVQNSVYNHYLSTYGSQDVSRYDAHKKSELRGLYNSMVKLNKNSPLYLIRDSKDAAQTAVDLKEMTRALRNDIASLGGLEEKSLLNKKAAFSSNEDVVTAKYIGSDETVQPSYQLEVKSLATGQTNLGQFLPGDAGVGLPNATYSFDITIHNLSYEFQFNINKEDTNRNVQNRLSRLISNSGIGIKASVVDGDGHLSALKLISDQVGLPDGKSEIFSISENNTSQQTGAVEYFGLNYTAIQPVNASFLLDGESHESTSNEFTLNQEYAVKLTGLTPDSGVPTTIGIKEDYQSLTDNIRQLFGSYNAFLQAAASYSGSSTSNRFNASRLHQDMSSITSLYQEQLHSIGVEVQEDGTVAVDEKAVAAAAQNANAAEQFQTVKSFTTQLLRKTNEITLDPLQYATKLIVAYKNPGHNYASPYVTSNYSGMLYNFYC